MLTVVVEMSNISVHWCFREPVCGCRNLQHDPDAEKGYQHVHHQSELHRLVCGNHALG